MRLLSALVLVAAAGCGGPPKPSCSAPFIGDPTQPPQAVMVYTDGLSQMVADVQPGMAIPLEPPPQGGYVMYLAARVQNMDGCVDFAGKLIDPVTQDQVGFDARGSTLQLGSDGWGYPNAKSNANLSNVNGCPDYSTNDVQGRSYTLQMTVTDKSGHSVTVTNPIVPTCNFSDPALQSDCICTCSANYFLGKCGQLSDGGSTD